MGIKEYTGQDEHQVMYISSESLYCTAKTNITLYVSSTGIKIKFYESKDNIDHAKTKVCVKNPQGGTSLIQSLEE